MSSVTFWTRLEPYTRLDDMDTGLQARVNDPLWLLARQWQTGEFGAEDAGTPVQARVRLERSPLSRFAAAGAPPVPYRGEVPLEALAEREPLQVAADPRRDRRLAAEAGQMFLRMLERAGVSAATRAAFAAESAFSLTADAGDDGAGAAYLALMAGRVPDGFKLYTALASGLPARPVVPAADAPKVTAVRPAYRAWYEARYGASTGSAWVPERLEYSFAVAAPAGAGGELVLEAAEYPGGELDWHAFDVAAGRTLGAGPGDEPAADVVRTVMPAPVRYPGIAADRWWQFEDARVNLSRVEGDPDELLRLTARRLLAAVLQRLVRGPGRRHLRRRVPLQDPDRHRRLRRAHARPALRAARRGGLAHVLAQPAPTTCCSSRPCCRAACTASRSRTSASCATSWPTSYGRSSGSRRA